MQLSRQAQKDHDATVHLLVTLMHPEDAERASKVEPGLIPNARSLIKETLGRVVVHTGRGPVEERVTIETA